MTSSVPPILIESDYEEDFQEPVSIDSRSSKRQKRVYSSPPHATHQNTVTHCPLCKQPWTNSGSHSIVSLKCGHLFGKSCITKHMNTTRVQPSQEKSTCPCCGHPAKRHEIWALWPTQVVPQDPTTLQHLKLALEATEYTISQREKELKASQETFNALCMELSALPKHYLMPTPNESRPPSPPPLCYQYLPWYTNVLSQERHKCRVMTINSRDETVASSLHHPALGHGIHKTSLRDTHTTDFIPIHTNVIRDIKHSQSTLLTTGLDKTLKLTCAHNNSILQTYTLGYAGWSCEFDPLQSNTLYCGLANDTVLVYDTRNTKKAVAILSQPRTTGGAQIHSLHAGVFGGKMTLLCANAKRAYAWQKNQSQTPLETVEDTATVIEDTSHSYTCQLLNVEKNVGYMPFSLSLNVDHGYILVSLRKQGSVEHCIAEWNTTEAQFQPQWSIQSSIEQKSLSKTAYFYHQEHSIVCYSDEAKGAMVMLDNTQTETVFPVQNTVMDIKHSIVNHSSIVAALTDTSLYIFKC
ncbi:hypothetical protein BDF14DRAFT_1221843 [Spinellus fusiger]|nr:hypothetical protein BDF14DRAFT_1221843 [Spinellus fusiger]